MRQTYLSSIFFLLLFLVSCSPAEKKEDTELNVKYDSFLIEYPLLASDSFFVDSSFASSSYKAFIDETGTLSSEEVNSLLEHELKTLRESPEQFLIGPSAPAIGDTTLGRMCATFDDAPRTTFKSLGGRRFMHQSIFQSTYKVRLAIHVIEDPAVGKVVTDADIAKQIDILNKAFATTNIIFEVDIIDRKPNKDWYYSSPLDDDLTAYNDMTSSMSTDPKKYYNIFINGMREYWGVAVFPWDTKRYQTTHDCVIIKDFTLPAKSLDDGCNQITMQGKTLIHEMGHFMGLFHTFHSDQTDPNGDPLACNHPLHDACSRGDGIPDTAPLKICQMFGCQNECPNGCCTNCGGTTTCDTCPGDTEVDPVKNFMGYNPDTCMDHFTPLQYNTMDFWFSDRRKYAVKTTQNQFN